MPHRGCIHLRRPSRSPHLASDTMESTPAMQPLTFAAHIGPTARSCLTTQHSRATVPPHLYGGLPSATLRHPRNLSARPHHHALTTVPPLLTLAHPLCATHLNTALRPPAATVRAGTAPSAKPLHPPFVHSASGFDTSFPAISSQTQICMHLHTHTGYTAAIAGGPDARPATCPGHHTCNNGTH